MNFMGGNQQQMQPMNMNNMNYMNGGQNLQMNGNMGGPDQQFNINQPNNNQNQGNGGFQLPSMRSLGLNKWKQMFYFIH